MRLISPNLMISEAWFVFCASKTCAHGAIQWSEEANFDRFNSTPSAEASCCTTNMEWQTFCRNRYSCLVCIESRQPLPSCVLRGCLPAEAGGLAAAPHDAS